MLNRARACPAKSVYISDLCKDQVQLRKTVEQNTLPGIRSLTAPIHSSCNEIIRYDFAVSISRIQQSVALGVSSDEGGTWYPKQLYAKDNKRFTK